MKMFYVFLMVCTALATLSAVAGNGGGMKPIDDLRSGDINTRLAAYQSLKVDRANLVNALKQMVEQEEISKDNSTGSKQLAIELLGVYRVPDAANLLIKNIEYKVFSISLEDVPAAAYPCVHALAKIGNPSLQGILERLGQPVTDQELKLFATVFRLVDGDDLAIMRAELAIKKAEGQQKENLVRLVTLLKQKQWFF
jgi:hypothetical protein